MRYICFKKTKKQQKGEGALGKPYAITNRPSSSPLNPTTTIAASPQTRTLFQGHHDADLQKHLMEAGRKPGLGLQVLIGSGPRAHAARNAPDAGPMTNHAVVVAQQAQVQVPDVAVPQLHLIGQLCGLEEQLAQLAVQQIHRAVRCQIFVDACVQGGQASGGVLDQTINVKVGRACVRARV
jgi:hypothetical protein